MKKYLCISCGDNSNSGRSKYCKECSCYWRSIELYAKLGINDNNLKIANHKTIELLKSEYFINKQSLVTIKEKYNIQFNTIHNFFKKNGIKLKNNSFANKESILLGRQTPENNLKYSISEIHDTWNGKKVYLRSSYEFDYAKILDDYEIDYEVEFRRIEYYDSVKGENRIAIPDFYLPKLNMIVEIKSNYTLDLQNMKDKFKSYKKLGYKTKLILDHIEFKI